MRTNKRKSTQSLITMPLKKKPKSIKQSRKIKQISNLTTKTIKNK